MHIPTHSPLYQQAFVQYLRKGTPIEISLKALLQKSETAANHSTPLYIWRTAGDGKVRPSHAVNEGRIFAWNNPPATGHPGEDYNCRCRAEPYQSRVNEYMRQSVISIVDEGLGRWQWYDFVAHFYFGGGKPISLSSVGHLKDIINQGQEKHSNQISDGVEKQIISAARKIKSGPITDTYSNAYDFSSVSYIHGGSTVFGHYQGYVTKEGFALKITAEIDYNFYDEFTDPVSLREKLFGKSLENIPQWVIDWIGEDNLLGISDTGGRAYKITGNWRTKLVGTVDEDPKKSIYP